MVNLNDNRYLALGRVILLMFFISSCSLTEKDTKELHTITIKDLKSYSLIDMIIDRDREYYSNSIQEDTEKQYLKEREKYYHYCLSKDKYCDIAIDIEFNNMCIDNILSRDISIKYTFDKESYLFFNRNSEKQNLLGIFGLRGRKNCLDDMNKKTTYIWKNNELKGNINGN